MKPYTYRFCLSYLCLQLLLHVSAVDCMGQCPTNSDVYTKLQIIENAGSLEPGKQLAAAMQLKKLCDDCRLPQDSVYARLLHKIGVYAYNINKQIPTSVSINYTLASIRINTAAGKGANPKFAVNSYYNLAMYYRALGQNEKALRYYDTLMGYNKNYPNQQKFTLDAINNQLNIYFEQGEYEKIIETSTIGIAKAGNLKDSLRLLQFYNHRAQAFVFQNIASALRDMDSAVRYAQLLDNSYEMATALKSKALFYERNKDYTTAESLYINAIEERKKSDLWEVAIQLPKDYNEYGNFILNAKKDYAKACAQYLKNVQYALTSGDNESLITAYTNLGQANFRQRRLQQAHDCYAKAAAAFNIAVPADFLQNAPASKMSLIENKDLLIVWLNNKTELLLQLYKQTNEKKYLDGGKRVALLTDSVITQLRHEQIGEQNKLYWRDRTREFFANALEVCYLANDKQLAFHFLERSRAVLLGDRLNELGALADLPDKEALQEQNLQNAIVEKQQRLFTLAPSSKEYNVLQAALYSEKDDQEKFISSLEQKYPSYYLYKYADNVFTLDSLQQYLATSHQSFIHYFMNDTVMYVLSVSQNNNSFIKLTQKDFDTRQLSTFLQLCSDKEKLRSNYPLFAAVAQNIYSKIFRPLQLPKGDVAICTDNFLIPFEALCTDAAGKNFLVSNYSFSYVYSARTFMKPYAGNTTTAGNFIGFAPVAFAPALRLVSLNQSAEALSQSAGFYSNHTLFTQNKATRGNFFANASKYKMIAIFSHAQADTSDREPVLYMHDSAIHLSELELLQKPSAAQLVLLSACQTNTGKTAAGEGVYSLARGFAAAGIPSVAGTLWKADDITIYSISSKFNEYLSGGMNKSKALQKAKLWFIQSHPNDEYQFPYFWANLVLIGNTQPVSLTAESYNWWSVAGIVCGAAIIIVALVIMKKSRRIKKNNMV